MSDLNWKEVVYYDPTSPSCLRWACNIPYKGTFGTKVSYKRVIGDVAGTYAKRDNRYKIKFKQKAYMAHRVVYELFFGPIPDGLVIDHIDGDASNNVITNLRAVSHTTNCRNTKKPKSNKTGVQGVALSLILDKYGKEHRYYNAMHTRNGKLKNKYFSINKLGEQEAFRLACEYRAKMIEELNRQGAGYTERHGT
jgi:hypothetical protein